ncbi:TetR/AcrR family transcriptional regulator [Yunchengibacter salinarum]|uniref:TetR/AcrR family transcriptional regulator n=1 Tax=Yunchengibacter salinarum TaxID=3133399 RepID=UPI0035B6386C
MDKRDHILTAADALFERSGAAAVPIDLVIRDAGVSPRTLYKHFPSKTDLVVAVLRARHDRFIAEVGGDEDTLPHPRQLLTRLAAWMRSVPNANGCLFQRLSGEMNHPAVDAEASRYKNAWRALVLSASRPFVSDTVQADSIYLLLEGVIALAPFHGLDNAVAAADRGISMLTGRT